MSDFLPHSDFHFAIPVYPDSGEIGDSFDYITTDLTPAKYYVFTNTVFNGCLPNAEVCEDLQPYPFTVITADLARELKATTTQLMSRRFPIRIGQVSEDPSAPVLQPKLIQARIIPASFQDPEQGIFYPRRTIYLGRDYVNSYHRQPPVPESTLPVFLRWDA